MDKSLTNFHLQRPPALLSYCPDFRHRVGQVGGEWPVDVGLQLLEKGEKTCLPMQDICFPIIEIQKSMLHHTPTRQRKTRLGRGSEKNEISFFF